MEKKISKSLLLVAMMFTMGLGGILFTKSIVVLYILMLLTGIGWGLNNNLINVMVSEATGGKSSYTNLLHMSFAIGAFISPLIVSTFIENGVSWKIPVGLISAAAAILFVVFLKMPLNESLQNNKSKEKLTFKFLKDPRYIVYMLILFCYVGAETGINSWLITYLVEEGIMEATNAQLMLSLLWVVIIVARIITAYISKYIRKDLLLLSQCIGMFVFFALFLINKNAIIAIMMICGIGISMAGIYPTTVANASYILTGAGLASGIMFSGGGFGATVAPYVVGTIAAGKGILVGMMSTLIIVMMMVGLAITNIILIKKEDSDTKAFSHLDWIKGTQKKV